MSCPALSNVAQVTFGAQALAPVRPVHFGGGCMRPQRRRVREKYSASSGANQRSFLQGESLTPRSLSFINPPPLPPFHIPSPPNWPSLPCCSRFRLAFHVQCRVPASAVWPFPPSASRSLPSPNSPPTPPVLSNSSESRCLPARVTARSIIVPLFLRSRQWAGT